MLLTNLQLRVQFLRNSLLMVLYIVSVTYLLEGAYKSPRALGPSGTGGPPLKVFKSKPLNSMLTLLWYLKPTGKLINAIVFFETAIIFPVFIRLFNRT